MQKKNQISVQTGGQYAEVRVTCCVNVNHILTKEFLSYADDFGKNDLFVAGVSYPVTPQWNLDRPYLTGQHLFLVTRWEITSISFLSQM